MSAALLRQIHPLEWDATRNEPFLRLPVPLSHIILTPPRMSDLEGRAELLNDPRVYNGLQNPPWPYTLEHSISWTTRIVGEWQEQLKQLEEAAEQGEDAPLVTFAFCPVACIRDASTEEQGFLGDFSLGRTQFEWEADEQERRRLIDSNEALPASDPAIVYTIGGERHWLNATAFLLIPLRRHRLVAPGLSWPGHHDRCRKSHRYAVGHPAHEREALSPDDVRGQPRQREGLYQKRFQARGARATYRAGQGARRLPG